MTTYANGRVPASALVQLDSGNGRHWSSPRSAAKWYRLRSLVKARHGVTLRITAGFNTLRDENAYRSFAGQEWARVQACASPSGCNSAAVAGYSSHGGTWRSAKYTGGVWVDAMAFDIGNYWEIGQEAFYRAARECGFLAGAITPELAGIFEPWHIIDLDNPFGPMLAGGGAVPFDPTEEDDMFTDTDRANLMAVRQTQLEDSAYARKHLFPQADETWKRVQSMHANGFLAVSDDAPGGNLAWLDVKLSELVERIAAAQTIGEVEAELEAFDLDAFAEAIAAKLQPADGAPPLSEADIERIAARVADSLHNRLAE